MERKNNKINLTQYYESLPKSTFPKKEFINKIMQSCDVSYTTARNWVKGNNKPLTEEQKNKVSSLCGIPVEQLW